MQLAKALQKMTDELENVDFAVDCYIDQQDLRILIDGTWQLPMDMGIKNRRQLIERAQLAKFGWKEKTIQDLHVRNTWEVAGSRITVEGPKWHAALQSALVPLAKRLGLSADAEIDWQLHNLLLYEKGQFFARHQDTEKVPDMLATLVIVLPCQHTGGELVVEKHTSRRSFDGREQRSKQVRAILFYADCHHAVLPVRTGNRLVLTYNVAIKQPKKARTKKVNSLTLPLQRYFSEGVTEKDKWDTARRALLAVLMDHQYTEKSLSWTRLKGRDRKTVEEFLANKEICGLEFALALVDVHETRDAYESGGWTEEEWYDESEFEDESDDDDDSEWSDFAPRRTKAGRRKRSTATRANQRRISVTRKHSIEVGDLVSTEYELIYCLNEDGHPNKKAVFKLHSAGLISLVDNSSFKAFASQHEGYMGNWGNTMESWYHRTALLVWRQADAPYFEFLQSPAKSLKNLARAWDNQLANNHKLLDLLSREIRVYCGNTDSSIPADLVTLLEKAGPSKFSYSIVGSLAHKLMKSSNRSKLRRLVHALGEAWLIDALNENKHGRFALDTDAMKHALVSLADLEEFAGEFASAVLQLAKNELVSSMEGLNSASPAAQSAGRVRFIDRATLLLQALAASKFNRAPLATQFCQAMISHGRFLTASSLAEWIITIAADADIAQRLKNQLGMLKDNARALLQKEIAQLPPDNSWTISTLSRCSCRDCNALNEFLKAPQLNALTLGIAEARREHLQRTIQSLDIPVKHTTMRQGTPYKLVLQKVPRLHTERKTARTIITKALEELS